MKQCFKCGVAKPLDEFYKHKEMADGHLNKCKFCTKSDAHSYQNGINREKYLQYQRQKPITEWSSGSSKRADTKHPERKKARAILRNAVLRGDVVKHPCFECGAKAEAHHPNYDAPLDVIWLCPTHHKQAHALINGVIK